MEPDRPLPEPTPVTRPFWDGLREHRVRLQKCRACGGWVFYPRAACSHCLSPELDWVDVSGLGTLYTYTVARVPTAPQFAADVPQLIAVVQLDEGVRLTTTLVGVDPAQVKVGMRVAPVFDDSAGGGVTLLRYRPA
jgi:uncharacterized OB-fold protein